MKQQTKSAKIIDLLAKTDLTREQIAGRVGCLPSYIRTVEQRLAAEPGNKPEQRWYRRNRETVLARMRAYSAAKYWGDAEYRERVKKNQNDRRRERRRSDPEWRERNLEYQRDYRRRKRAESRA